MDAPNGTTSAMHGRVATICRYLWQVTQVDGLYTAFRISELSGVPVSTVRRHCDPDYSGDMDASTLIAYLMLPAPIKGVLLGIIDPESSHIPKTEQHNPDLNGDGVADQKDAFEGVSGLGQSLADVISTAESITRDGKVRGHEYTKWLVAVQGMRRAEADINSVVDAMHAEEAKRKKCPPPPRLGIAHS